MKIGNVNIDGYAALAPMAGVADMAFRELCVEYGAAYVVSEMVSAKGVSMHDRKSGALMVLSEKERPAAIQIFGSDPKTMADAAIKAQNFTCEIVDINMGCPAPKIVNSGNGSALMKNPALAAEITAECVKAVTLPVTVKMRSGWDENSINAVELAKRCEASGASAITVHGRTRAQMYAPPVNIDIIREVKKNIKIPVIGNGDIDGALSAKAMFENTGCDFVMVGRGALGRPWVFAQINEYFRTGNILPEPPLEERMRVMLTHIQRLCDYKGVYIGMREARKHAAWYIRDIRGAAAFRNEIGKLETMQELHELAQKVIRNNPGT
ncbi:MAG: tRNA dihydrouridine synthase DusB [Clostridia bacterium]|nr:tRNA dihydrouridine synthase DusB [Clostridia bacterium]